ncbi:hypothetical protein PBI_DEWDROP_103 [Microbacterium phage Dewdrop]|nr:hypothetical protein PBI_LEAF_103 [Microbacterium phage Leaf]QGZ17471.1 hypothetical protein PBI_DEWDROP_103 [Microbacterium phage Dewdrop]
MSDQSRAQMSFGRGPVEQDDAEKQVTYTVDADGDLVSSETGQKVTIEEIRAQVEAEQLRKSATERRSAQVRAIVEKMMQRYFPVLEKEANSVAVSVTKAQLLDVLISVSLESMFTVESEHEEKS